MKNRILGSLILMSLVATSVYAEPLKGRHVRLGVGAHGEFNRQTQQTQTSGGFVRNTVTTNAQGDTASRNVVVNHDKETGIRTRTVDGTNFSGGQYSGQSITQKTDDGFKRESSFTNADGKTTSKSMDVVIDREAGTATKNISVTHPNGEVTTKTQVTSRSQTTNEPVANAE